MENEKQIDDIDTGFHHGDDNKIQRAMLENLEKRHVQLVADGHTDEAESAKADIDALKIHMAEDHANDPYDKTPDDLSIEVPSEE
jgi:hypothetical protein